jgi:tripeptide aminopeptidase
VIDEKIAAFLQQDARERFLRYVRIDTISDEKSGDHPSSAGQWNLAHLLKNELEALELEQIHLDEACYLYATLPASDGVATHPITFCAHLDTSPSEPGTDVNPVRHEAYDGGTITFPDNPDLTLSPTDSPELAKCAGHTIITASGNTLLGADDKAGVAEIMAALSAFKTFPHLRHPELRIVFTPDEEIGEGTALINMDKLGTCGYTIDGGDMGELEEECFDAMRATLEFHGHNVHPGKAKNRMVNAGAIAARFLAALPEYDTPEHTEVREGFWHLTEIHGHENHALISMIIRDFEHTKNEQRIQLLQNLTTAFETKYPGLRIELTIKEQYKNMREVLKHHADVTQKAADAITRAGLTVKKNAIRGGTDGARLSFKGMPTPNIFSGGMLVHSKKEWISELALQKAAEVILHLCELWA